MWTFQIQKQHCTEKEKVEQREGMVIPAPENYPCPTHCWWGVFGQLEAGRWGLRVRRQRELQSSSFWLKNTPGNQQNQRLLLDYFFCPSFKKLTWPVRGSNSVMEYWDKTSSVPVSARTDKHWGEPRPCSSELCRLFSSIRFLISSQDRQRTHQTRVGTQRLWNSWNRNIKWSTNKRCNITERNPSVI